MTIHTQLTDNDKTLTISVHGDFNFNLLREFRTAYSDEDFKHCKIIVDLSHTIHIDSSALGMLIAMQSYLNKPDGEIHISNANDEVSKILGITHFNEKFTLE